MFDPPITSGANLFIIIALGVISLVAAVVATDVYKNFFVNKKEQEERD